MNLNSLHFAPSLTVMLLGLLLVSSFVVVVVHAAEDSGDDTTAGPEIDFEVDLSEADQLLEKLRRKANITYDEPGMHFIATTNEDLIPYFPEERRKRKVRSTSAMIRRTEEFGLFFKGGKGLQADSEREDPFGQEDHDDREDRDDRARAEVIRGTTQPFHTYNAKVLTVPHGLISTVLEAYNRHLNLRLRPDDVWITILTQFSSYVNGEGRAEKLRSKFVDHDGKKELEVVSPEAGSIYTVDFGVMTRLMLEEIVKNIKDDTLREWFLPGFSTTTENDEVCASAAAMCTMQAYFEYNFRIFCGIPEVTLLGEVEDWENLRAKVDRLLEFQVEDDNSLAIWVGLLQRICDNFVESRKNGAENNMKFWDTVAHRTEGGSFVPFLSGWISTFSFYDSEGRVVSSPSETFEDGSPKWLMNPAAYIDPEDEKYASNEDEYSSWPIISTHDLVTNVVSCPVRIDDNGTPYDARLFVGQMAMDFLHTSRAMKDRATPIAGNARGKLRMVQGRNDWALVIAKPENKG